VVGLGQTKCQREDDRKGPIRRTLFDLRLNFGWHRDFQLNESVFIHIL
jgi:hypothetical protein